MRRLGLFFVSQRIGRLWSRRYGNRIKRSRFATYQIVSSLPLELQGQLPSPEQVARLLGGM
jgi:hypothetical protein